MSHFFNIKKKDIGYSRFGEIECVHENVITPCYIPVVPFLDSSDDSIRTENITKSFPKKPGLSQVLLHNKDGKLSKSQKEKLSTKIHETHPQYEGALFLDSGGFKLIRMDIEDMPFKEVFDIQKDVGGDIFFTLDYPIIKDMPFPMQIKRANKSLDNAIKALQYRKDLWGTATDKPIVYVAVHGTSTQFVRDYLEEFFRLLKKHDLEDVPFGFAHGSLVPLKHRRYLVLDFLYETKMVLKEKDMLDKVPIHAFGISGSLIPHLGLLGIDTFDSASYLLSAGNHQIFDPETLETISFMEKEDSVEKGKYCKRRGIDPTKFKNLKEAWGCDCMWCEKVKNAYPPAKENLVDFARIIQRVVPQEGGWREDKDFLQYLKDRNFAFMDYLYVHMICHNLTVTNNLVSKMHEHLRAGTYEGFFFDFLNKVHQGNSKKQVKQIRFLNSILKDQPKFYDLAAKHVPQIKGRELLETNSSPKRPKLVDFKMDTSGIGLHPGKHKKAEKKIAAERRMKKEQTYFEDDLL